MSLEVIKKVRSATGAGVVEVKKALEESDNDETKAIEVLRKKGQQMAAKRAGRSTAEGVIAIADAGGKIALAKLTCETDFVARNEDFITAVQELAAKALIMSADELTEYAEKKIKNELIVKIGENMQWGGSQVVEGKILSYYLHSNKKLAAIVSMKQGSAEVARDVAMHAAAMKPEYLQPENVPADVVAKEKEIYQEQMKGQNKPADIMEKILEGKIQKYYSEVCLLKQAFVKDDKKTIEQYLADNGAVVEKFVIMEL